MTLFWQTGYKGWQATGRTLTLAGAPFQTTNKQEEEDGEKKMGGQPRQSKNKL